jgi:PPOX class probable F420-dependent enzyme
MTAEQARERFTSARVGHLATADAQGRPHLVPIVFAVKGDTVVHAVDHKPKRTTALRRLSNIMENPRVCLLADAYDDEDWSRLWWVRAEGVARVHEPGSPEARDGVAALQERYAQYREIPPAGPVVAVEVRRWSGWSGDSRASYGCG